MQKNEYSHIVAQHMNITHNELEMGIRGLNTYLHSKCDNARSIVPNTPLDNFRNKTIVVDTSIYMYKYASVESLLGNMYKLITMLQYYKIRPLFIFDGKPNVLKSNTLKKRRIIRRNAQNKCEQLSNYIKSVEHDMSMCDLTTVVEPDMSMDSDNHVKLKDAQTQLRNLRQTATRIHSTDVDKVKELISACGETHYTAVAEADELCSQLVLNNIAWGCLSDDMDMLLYGCPYVLRNVDLRTHTVQLYILDHILSDLHLTHSQFVQICVLSGTDYTDGLVKQCVDDSMLPTEYISSLTTSSSIELPIHTISDVFNMHREYNTYVDTCTTDCSFYAWVKHNKTHDINVDLLHETCVIFEQLHTFKFVKTRNNFVSTNCTDTHPPCVPKLNKSKLSQLLLNDGYVFI